MTEIAKNIRKIRNSKKLTQEELAAKINVTRQAVSNWENNKTQPDIEMLTNIANAFEIGIEELIYGKKYIKKDRENNEQKTSIIKIALAVFGSILIAIGLVIVFFNFWEAFPNVLKTVFTFLPLICAQGFAAFVLMKKGDRVSWRECAGTVLIIGVVSSVALVNSVLDIHCGFDNCLLIDTLLCLPIIFLFDAVMPLAVLLGFSGTFAFFGDTAVSLLIILVCFVFILLNRKNIFDVRFKLSAWLIIIASLIFTCGTCVAGEDYERSAVQPVMMMFPFVLGVIRAKEESLFVKPLRVLHILSSIVIMSVSVYLLADFSLIDETENLTLFLISTFICMAIFLVLLAGKIKNCKEQANIFILSGLSTVLWIVCMFAPVVFELKDSELPMYISSVFAGAFGVSKIIEGVNNTKLLPINAGLIIIFAQMFLLLQLLEPDAILIGVMLIMFGIVLLAVNSFMTRKAAKINQELQEVNCNEKEC